MKLIRLKISESCENKHVNNTREPWGWCDFSAVLWNWSHSEFDHRPDVDFSDAQNSGPEALKLWSFLEAEWRSVERKGAESPSPPGGKYKEDEWIPGPGIKRGRSNPDIHRARIHFLALLMSWCPSPLSPEIWDEEHHQNIKLNFHRSAWGNRPDARTWLPLTSSQVNISLYPFLPNSSAPSQVSRGTQLITA